MIITGSTAMYNFDKSWRSPKDFDYFTVEPVDVKGDGHQIPEHVYNKLSEYTKDGYLTPEGMYNLKVSHSFFDVKWDKTKFDILMMQDKYNFKEIDKSFYDVLYPFWKQIHAKGNKVNLNKPIGEFFTDKVVRKYDHDFIHESIAYYDKPMFTKILVSPDKALTDYNKFVTLTNEDKIKLCREEIYVIALERFMIPNDYKFNTLSAYQKAFKKLITTMTKGWFPLFMVENLKELNKPDTNFVKTFKERLIDENCT